MFISCSVFTYGKQRAVERRKTSPRCRHLANWEKHTRRLWLSPIRSIRSIWKHYVIHKNGNVRYNDLHCRHRSTEPRPQVTWWKFRHMDAAERGRAQRVARALLLAYMHTNNDVGLAARVFWLLTWWKERTPVRISPAAVTGLPERFLSEQVEEEQMVKEFWRKAASPSCHPSRRRMDLSDVDPISCMVLLAHVNQPQTASQLVKLFLRTMQRYLPIFFSGADNPRNCSFRLRDLDPHLIHRSVHLLLHSPHMCLTHRHAHHATCDIRRNSPHLCGLKINWTTGKSRFSWTVVCNAVLCACVFVLCYRWNSCCDWSLFIARGSRAWTCETWMEGRCSIVW